MQALSDDIRRAKQAIDRTKAVKARAKLIMQSAIVNYDWCTVDHMQATITKCNELMTIQNVKLDGLRLAVKRNIRP